MKRDHTGSRWVIMSMLISGIAGGFWSIGCGSNGDPTPPTPPTPSTCSAPAGVQAVGTRKQITLQWSVDSCPSIYKIYWSKTAGVTTSDTSVEVDQPPFLHEGLTDGTTLYYRVAAVNDAGESDLSDEVTATPWPRVFVTSASGTGKLSTWEAVLPEGTQITDDIQGADAICNALAMDAGISATFAAWISDSANDAVCHVQGFSGKKAANCGEASLPAGPGPWMLMTDVKVAESINDIITQNPPLLHAIDADELGEEATGDVWTGTYYAGTFLGAGEACSDWTSNSDTETATIGDSAETFLEWTSQSGATLNCSDNLHLYCFER